MRLRRGFALLLALGVALALPACDSDDHTPGLEEVDGSYTATRLRFDASNIDVGVNLLSRLESPARLEIVGSEEEFSLFYDLPNDNQGRRRLRGSVTRGRDGLRFDVEAGDASNLLLPTRDGTDFRMRVQDDGAVLVGGADGSGISLNEVDLSAYGIDQTLNGSLSIRFERE